MVVITNSVGSTNVTWTNMILANPGMVEAWGTDEFGECNRPLWLTNTAAIAAGEYQSIAVTDAGSVVQWGRYTNGSNMYAVTNTAVATQPPTSGVVAVAAGYGQALALLSSNGTVTAWGLTNDPSSTVPLGFIPKFSQLTGRMSRNNVCLVVKPVMDEGQNFGGRSRMVSTPLSV